MAGNTEILIRRSLSTGKPGSLKQGELAYSYASNTIFIGTPDGLGTVNVGGQFYTSQIDSATHLSIENTIVRRDSSGDASFNTIYGSLGTTISSLGAGEYGDQTHIPVITVAANGIVTNVTTSVISTTLGIDGDVGGPSSVDLLSQSLLLTGGQGITSNVNGQEVIFDVDTTVVRSNTAMVIQTIDGDVQISGNLTVSGNVQSIDVTTLNISDPLIYLAANNYTSDTVDIGFAGNYFDGATQRHTGVYRHAGNQQYYIFDNYEPEPTDNLINPADPSFHLATLHANLTAPTANLTQAHITTANVSGDIGVVGSAFVGTNLHVTGGATLVGQANTTNDLGVGGNLLVVGSSDVDTLFVRSLPQANTNYVVYYDTTSKELKYDSIDTLAPDNLANGSSYFAVSSDGYAYSSGKVLAAQSSSGTTGGGFSFTGTEGVADTGMFSSSDGVLNFYNNNILNFATSDYTFQVHHDLTLANNSVLGDSSGSLYLGKNITGTTGSIIFNNSGVNLTAAAAGLYINPVRYTETQDATYDGVMFYNASTKEVRYSYALDGGSF